MIHKLKRLFLVVVASALTVGGVLPADLAFAATLNTHTVVLDGSGKIIPWTANPTDGYDTAVNLSWNYLLNSVPNDSINGQPAYMSHSYMDPNTQQPVGWPHNPAGLYSMLIESAQKYYKYSGNAAVMTLAQNVANRQLQSGMTAPTDNWANVPYSSGDSGSLTYRGAAYGNDTGVGDGVGIMQPDKVAEMGMGFLELYQYSGNTAYRDAAINAANALASHVRTGDASHSPWPFRVVAATGAIKEEYCANIIAPIELFDELNRLGLGNTASYQTARTTAWNWMMTYPMQNNVWTQYFEDVGIKSNYAENITQYNAMMVARYLLEHPEMDPSWESHVRGLISWVEANFGVMDSGALTIKEQWTFWYPMGSHTSRYASVNALLYEKTGDTAAKEKAYRSLNWATYMARSNGVVIDGPQVNNQWFTDGYGDYVRHFMTSMGAVPEWAPANQSHMVESTSIVKSVAYSAGGISYTTSDTASEDTFKLAYVPAGVTVDGQALSQRSDLTQPGWTYDSAKGVLKVRHDTGTMIQITSGVPGNNAPTVSLTSPAGGATFAEPATVQLAANAADSDGTIAKVDFFRGSTLIGTSSSAPYAYTWSNVPAGNYAITAVATDNQGAVTSSSPVTISVTASSTLPSPWIASDIGSTGVAGSSSYAGGTFTVKGSGVDIWDASDSFHYVYQSLNGDGQITARVASLQNTDSWALAGVMIRESLAANSRHAIAAVTPSNGAAFTWRSTAGGISSYTNGNAASVPSWVRLNRAGNVFTAYKSSNGTTWTQIAQTTIAMGTTAYAGLAGTSHNNSVLATDTFDNVSVTGSVDTTAPVISAISASNISQNGASINWTTNEASDSQVEYGLTTSYGTSSPLNTSLTTAHTQVVAGLDAGVTYHYRVKSRDAAGNLATSADMTFVTPGVFDTTPPVLSGISATNISQTGATVNWTTNEAADTQVEYGLTTLYGASTPLNTTLSTAHTQAIAGLDAGSTYHYRVKSRDAAGNLATSADMTFVTASAPDTTAPSIPTGLAAGTVTTSSVPLSWTASTDDVAVTGYQVLRGGVQIGTTSTTSYTDNTVVANIAYSYTVRAYDAAGNVSADSTPPLSVTTPAPSANQIAVDKIVTTKQTTNGSTIVSPSLTTAAPGELLVAFIASDGPASAQTFSSVTGGGLTWTLRKRANTQAGNSEIWTAYATNVVTNITVTATRSKSSYQGMISVVAFQNASATIGATNSASAGSGAPTVNLTTTGANSVIWGVGNDWDGATARTVGSGQTKVSEALVPAGDTFWVQNRTAAVPTSGTVVTINDTAPTNHRWNLAAIEILRAQ